MYIVQQRYEAYLTDRTDLRALFEDLTDAETLYNKLLSERQSYSADNMYFEILEVTEGVTYGRVPTVVRDTREE